MWVNIDLKAPDEGEWIALTSIDADGIKTPLGYLDREVALELLRTFGYLNRILGGLVE